MGVPGCPKLPSGGPKVGFGGVREASEGSPGGPEGVSFGVSERNPEGSEPPAEVAGGVPCTPLNCISATSKKVSIGGSRSNRKIAKSFLLRN